MTMKEYLSIQKLGPIENVELELKPFMMLIGESASGKSTILKAAALMKFAYQVVAVQSYLHRSAVTKPRFSLKIDLLLSTFGLGHMFRDNTVVEYKVAFTEDSSDVYILTIDGSGDPEIDLIDASHLSYDKIAFIVENRSQLTDNMNGNDSDAKLLSVSHNDFFKASSTISELDLPFLGLQFLAQKDEEEKTVYSIQPSNKEYEAVKLENASSGIQTAVPVALITKYLANHFSFKDDFRRAVLQRLLDDDELTKFNPAVELKDMRKRVAIHIEEPELSLYPDAQRLLISHLVTIVNNADEDREMRLMFATHSPYILNHVAYLLEASYYPEKAAERGLPELKPENVQVYKVAGGKASSLMATTPEGHVTVNTMALSTTMADIYNDTKSLRDA